jgi:ABC-type Co2+ transport system permease subunit
MTRQEVINSVICVLFPFHASIFSGVSLDQPWSVFFLIKFVIFFRQEILGNFGIFLVTANSTNSAIFFQYCKVGRKKAWAIHDH